MQLRPVDLARVAGVSTQQIRNYEDAGLLPPVVRTAAGHRRYDEDHRAALLTYRALAAGYGARTAQAIMHAVLAGEVEQALAEVDAAHAEIHAQRGFLHDTGKVLEAVAEETPEEVRRTGLHIREVARLLGVRTSALRVWETAGLLAPEREPGTGYRTYTSADVRDARMIHLLRQSYYPLPQIGPVLDGLRRTGSSAELRAAIARRQAELARRTMAMLAGAGQLYEYLASGSASS